MISAKLPHRGVDEWGSGHYGAARGDRAHKGVDYACYPGSEIYAPVSGTVTKLGHCYADDLSYRYVQITDDNGYQHRFFYVDPSDCMVLTRIVHKNITMIGRAQDIACRYSPSMKNHIHYEIKDPAGIFVNPELYSDEIT